MGWDVVVGLSDECKYEEEHPEGDAFCEGCAERDKSWRWDCFVFVNLYMHLLALVLCYRVVE